MKDSLIAQISDLNTEDKIRLQRIMEGFLFDNKVDYNRRTNKGKISYNK